MEERSGLSCCAWRGATLLHLVLLHLLLLVVTAASALQSAASGGDPVAEGPGLGARPLTPVHLRARVTLPEGHLAFLLHTANPHADLFRNASARLLQAPFVMLGARGVRPLSEPRVNATFGPFRVSRPIPPELLGPSLGGWSDGPRGGPDAASSSGGRGGPAGSGQAARLRAVLVQEKVYSSSPKVQVLFHATGRDWDDHSDIASLPCVHLHAFRETREARGSCRLDTNLGLCLAELALPLAWFAPPTVVPGRRQRPLGESQAAARVELYFSVRPAEADGSCRGDEARQQQQRAGGGVRGVNSSSRRGRDAPGTRHHRPLLRIGSVGLLLSPPSPPVTESRLEGGVALLIPEKSFRPGEVISITVTLPRNSTLERFTVRAKAKKGIEVLGAQPVDPSAWELSSDIINSGKPPRGGGGGHAAPTRAQPRRG
ncbi:transmembrane protein 132D-like [Petromyzon marinus]|uniref:transmembrane protein 132D-like n=1 Tax=Petromyzon marinus TaxID=7757 RepID=UPI003F72BA15